MRTMNKNQQILLKYLESLIPKDDVLLGLAEFQIRLGDHSVPKEVYVALGVLNNNEINSVLHELTKPA
ncbi:hypothetical protein TY91_11690 [Secundilactobacillus collinoides]|uniref:Uncharacterized protein n=2 Tax=Secundilactobacillus collinoides TaxID=33960 RepID=A0A166GE86_SECCO|nr:hypothetical protein TY91_11690 [Secundilactobacillus collinoides]